MRQDDTVRIPLRTRDGSARAYTVVDADDAEWANRWRWHLDHDGYAFRLTPRPAGQRNGTRHSIRLHRDLLGLKHGDLRQVDHISRDRLDNRRANLRIVTRRGNTQNRSTAPGSSSGFRGVTWHKSAGRWQAQVQVGGKKIYLGLFDDVGAAAEAAKSARMRLLEHAID